MTTQEQAQFLKAQKSIGAKRGKDKKEPVSLKAALGIDRPRYEIGRAHV